MTMCAVLKCWCLAFSWLSHAFFSLRSFLFLLRPCACPVCVKSILPCPLLSCLMSCLTLSVSRILSRISFSCVFLRLVSSGLVKSCLCLCVFDTVLVWPCLLFVSGFAFSCLVVLVFSLASWSVLLVFAYGTESCGTESAS